MLWKQIARFPIGRLRFGNMFGSGHAFVSAAIQMSHGCCVSVVLAMAKTDKLRLAMQTPLVLIWQWVLLECLLLADDMWVGALRTDRIGLEPGKPHPCYAIPVHKVLCWHV